MLGGNPELSEKGGWDYLSVGTIQPSPWVNESCGFTKDVYELKGNNPRKATTRKLRVRHNKCLK